MTIDQVNALPRPEFVDALGWIFEHSPWVAERVWERRPFASWEDLHGKMRGTVDAATHSEQLVLLQAHPDLGTRARMSAASQTEQAGAGLDRVPSYELEILLALNSEYREKFGFPFIYAVKGSPAQDILSALMLRLEGSPEEEFGEALRQVYRIAWFRLSDQFKGA